jgi:hypothetical protein
LSGRYETSRSERWQCFISGIDWSGTSPADGTKSFRLNDGERSNDEGNVAVNIDPHAGP